VSGGHETYRSPDGDNSLDGTVHDDVPNIFRDETLLHDDLKDTSLIGSIKSTDEGGFCKMDWWGWLLIVIAFCVVGMVACGGPKNFFQYLAIVICCPCVTCAAAVGCGVCVQQCQDDDEEEDEQGKKGKKFSRKMKEGKMFGFTSPFEDEEQFKKDVSKKCPCFDLCFDIDEVYENVKENLNDLAGEVKKKVESVKEEVESKVDSTKESLKTEAEKKLKKVKSQAALKAKKEAGNLKKDLDLEKLQKKANDALTDIIADLTDGDR